MLRPITNFIKIFRVKHSGKQIRPPNYTSILKNYISAFLYSFMMLTFHFFLLNTRADHIVKYVMSEATSHNSIICTDFVFKQFIKEFSCRSVCGNKRNNHFTAVEIRVCAYLGCLMMKSDHSYK